MALRKKENAVTTMLASLHLLKVPKQFFRLPSLQAALKFFLFARLLLLIPAGFDEDFSMMLQ